MAVTLNCFTINLPVFHRLLSQGFGASDRNMPIVVGEHEEEDVNSQAHRCTEALQGHLDVPDDSLSHRRYQRSTSTSPNMTPAVAAASNISSPGAAALDPPLPLTPLRLESDRADCQGPLMPRQPSGHSLARLKHSQSTMVSLGGMPRATTMERWHSPLLVSPGDARCA